MEWLELTLSGPAGNLALDEALLLSAETGAGSGNVLRLWESQQTFVVLGRGSKIDDEVDRKYCEAHAIPILRRVSGGGTIVTGPGCLMYAVLLSFKDHPLASHIDEAHAYVLDRIAQSITDLGQQVVRAGISDLVLPTADQAGVWRKVSGNSMRRSRSHSLYHGTLLYDMDLGLVQRCLKTPPRMPEYRKGRSHDRFVGQLTASSEALATAVKNAWLPGKPKEAWPRKLVDELVEAKYSRDDWNARH